MLGAAQALVAVLIVDGLQYFQYTAAKFNHDVIQLPLWALAGYSFHAAIRRGPHLYYQCNPWLVRVGCQGGDDFFEARVATQRIPKRQ